VCSVPFKLLPVILPLPAPSLRRGSTRDSEGVSCYDDHGELELEVVCGERGGPGLSCIMHHVSIKPPSHCLFTSNSGHTVSNIRHLLPSTITEYYDRKPAYYSLSQVLWSPKLFVTQEVQQHISL